MSVPAQDPARPQDEAQPPPGATPAEPSSLIDRLVGAAGPRPNVSLRDVDAEGSGAAHDPPVDSETRGAGKYLIQGELGRGGVGAVHRGHDTELGRAVAMKFLHERYRDHEGILRRFIEEAQIGGQLQHPGIVPVYDLGIADGKPFFAMKLVQGETLSSQLARRPDLAADRRRFLQVFEQVCQTMAYAHARGVVHRDLKPANIMIGAFGEVQVVDWGMGKVLTRGAAGEPRAAEPDGAPEIATVRSTDDGSHSLHGSIMGTPSYMPPEQALGQVDQMDERSDVFALGAILCEIVTGKPAYDGELDERLDQAAQGDTRNAIARLDACGAPAALVDLAKRCLSAERAGRPADAKAVADEVTAHLSAVEERARQAELLATRARYRQRLTLLCAAAALVVFAVAGGGYLFLEKQEQAQRERAALQLAEAMGATHRAHGEAQAAGLDAGKWELACASADQLAKLASVAELDATARAEAQRLAEQVRAERATARDELARRQRDAEMVERLETLRIPTADDILLAAWEQSEMRRLDGAYAAAFAAYAGGLSLADAPSDALLAELRRGDLEAALATSLDHWSFVRDAIEGATPAGGAGFTARLRELAAALDPATSVRQELRLLLPDAKRSGAALRDLAARADLGSLAAAGCRLLCEALRRSGELEAATRVFVLAQELHPRDFDLCFRLALHYATLAPPRHDDAIATLRMAMVLRPEYDEVAHRLGRELAAAGRREEALRVFQRLAPRESPRQGHWLGHLGDELFACGQLDAARDAFQRAIALEPDEARLHANLGLVEEALRRVEPAVAAYRRAIELDPGIATVHVNLAHLLLSLGQVDEAFASYGRALELAPDNVIANYNYGRALADAGRVAEARECYRKAASGTPRDAQDRDVIVRANVNLGNVELGLGKPEQAVTHYRAALALDPRFVTAWANLGATLFSRLRRPDEALEAYEEATALVPDDWELRVQRSAVLFALGRYTEQRVELERVVALHASNPVAWLNLAGLRQMRGRVDLAAEAYEKGLALLESPSGPLPPGLAGQVPSVRRQLAAMRTEIERVDDLLEGRREPANGSEWATAIAVGGGTGRAVEALELAQSALEEPAEAWVDTGWGTYDAASAAVTLAGEEGTEAAESARLHGLARSWLRRSIDHWRALVAAGGPEAREMASRLDFARHDPSFAPVRGDALAELPEEERAAWASVWDAVGEPELPRGR